MQTNTSPLPGDAGLDRFVLPRRGTGRPWIGRGLVFVALVLLVNAVFGEQGLADRLRARRQISAAVADLASLRATNAGLREQIRQLQEDPAAIEHVARRELGLIRRGEILVLLRDRPAAGGDHGEAATGSGNPAR